MLDVSSPASTLYVVAFPVAVVNPVCGRQRGERLRRWALAELRGLFPDISVVETAGPGHATELARAASSAGLVIAVGGDGTVREVARGLLHTDTALAIIPVGSGNDFIKTVGVPGDIAAACRTARFGTPRRFDAVRITAFGSGQTGGADWSDIFVNAAGFGFDAQVVAEATRLHRLNGLPLYVAAVFRAVRNYECPKVRIRFESGELEQSILLVAATNGRFYGGGMKIAPGALPDDGQLEVCVIEAVSRFTVVRRLPRFIAGTHTTLREVRALRSAWVELEFLEAFRFQLDGDLQPDTGQHRFRIEILPAALQVVV